MNVACRSASSAAKGLFIKLLSMLQCFSGITVIEQRERLPANREPDICRGIVMSLEQLARAMQPPTRDRVFAAERIVATSAGWSQHAASPCPSSASDHAPLSGAACPTFNESLGITAPREKPSAVAAKVAATAPGFTWPRPNQERKWRSLARSSHRA